MLRIEIATDNAAFHNLDGEPNPGPEASRLLRDVAKKVEAGATEGKIIDINGNTVGRFDTILPRE